MNIDKIRKKLYDTLYTKPFEWFVKSYDREEKEHMNEYGLMVIDHIKYKKKILKDAKIHYFVTAMFVIGILFLIMAWW